MRLNIIMPEWLVNFWTIYGDMITPVLVSLGMAVLTYMAVKIRSDANKRKAEAEAQITALKAMAEKQNAPNENTEQTQRLDAIEKTLAYFAEMFNLAFQNSNLTPEIKNNLSSLKNKILYGSEDDLVKSLEEQIVVLKEQVDTLTTQASQNAVEIVTEEVQKRIRR